MAFNPVLLSAMSEVEPQDAGLASGVVNTSFMMGGALGLAVLASLAAWRTSDLLAGGSAQVEALNGGYQVAFLAGAGAALAAGLIGGLFLRSVAMPDGDPHGAGAEVPAGEETPVGAGQRDDLDEDCVTV
jgi:hypothetical protein